MIPSKVTISAETREKLNNPVLSPIKKRQLREEMIKESIRKAVGGVRSKQELIAAAGLNPDAKSNSYAKGHNLIGSMIKRGMITHDNSKTYRKVWTVLQDVRVTPTPKQVAKEILETKPEIVVKPVEKKELDSVSLLDMAKDFSWRENSDSLRDFINYMEKAIK